MQRHHCRRAYIRVAAVAILLLEMVGTIEGVFTASARQVSGTSYTSPSIGYSVTWQSPWYVVEEDVDPSGFDLLRIADSRSEVVFLGGRWGSSNSSAAVQQFGQQLSATAGYMNFQGVNDPQCENGSGASNVASACYRADYSYNDGSQGSVGIYVKAWSFADGVTLLLRAITEESVLPGYIAHWNNFGVFESGAPLPDTVNGCISELHHGVTFCFDSALSERDQSDIVEGTRLGQDAIAKVEGTQPIGDVRVSGLSSTTPSGDKLIATTYRDSIAVYTGSEIWQIYTPIERIEALVHEYFHVFQNSMMESQATILPSWFVEGSAESFGFTVVSQIGVTDQAEFYSFGFYRLTKAPVAEKLQDLVTSATMGSDEYALAYMAVQYLLGSEGLSIEALVRIYQELGAGATFEAAFASVFGLPLDQFYADFESWRLNVPRVNTLDDDFYLKSASAPDAAIAWRSFPAESHPGEQMVFVGQTEALASCELTIFFAGQSIRRETWANGQGEVFWLLSLPENTATGPGWVSVTCGGLPHSSVFGIS